MLYLFNDSLNVNNQKYLYESVASMITHYSAIATTKQFTDDNYRINNNELKIAISETFTIADAVSKNTVIHTLGETAEYKRVYNVIRYRIQSGYIYYDLAVDLWHTYIYEADVRNLRVIRSTRDIKLVNVSKGFYASPKQPLQTPTYTPLELYSISDPTTKITSGDNDEFIGASNLVLIIALKYNTYQTSDSAVSTVKLFGLNIGDICNAWINDVTGTDQTLGTMKDMLLQLVGGIYKATFTTSSTDTKCQVLNAWIVESECVQLSPQYVHPISFTTRTTFTGWTDKTFTPQEVTPNEASRIIEYEGKKNSNLYFGTKYTNIKSANKYYLYNEIEIRYIVGSNDIKVLAIEGENQVDITQAFALNITTVEGDATTQRLILTQIENTLPIIASAGTIAVGAMSYNPVAVGGGILSMANSLTKFAETQLPQKTGNVIKAGDAVTTFMAYDYSKAICLANNKKFTNPYYCIEIADDITSIDELEYYGLVYDITIDYITELFSFNDASTKSAVIGTVDGYDYLQCSDLTFNGNIPKEAQEYIFSKLLGGIRIKEL